MGDVSTVVTCSNWATVTVKCSDCGYPRLSRRDGDARSWSPEGALVWLPCPVCEARNQTSTLDDVKAALRQAERDILGSIAPHTSPHELRRLHAKAAGVGLAFNLVNDRIRSTKLAAPKPIEPSKAHRTALGQIVLYRVTPAYQVPGIVTHLGDDGVVTLTVFADDLHLRKQIKAAEARGDQVCCVLRVTDMSGPLTVYRVPFGPDVAQWSLAK